MVHLGRGEERGGGCDPVSGAFAALEPKTFALEQQHVPVETGGMKA